uniref:Zgc:101716 n=1 Tax=Amphilophus citrinellus TaxID=61819 RepID=A0A3Q0SRD6_AMPCI
MEILGSTFDDSVFSEVRDRVCASLSSYSAKLCEPEWFCESAALETEDSLEKQKVYKFRGDLAVRQGNYQKALEAYSSCLQWIADNNLTIRRDVVEGMARCCTKLGQRDRALPSHSVEMLFIFYSKVSIYEQFGAVGSKMSSLQQLCSLLPFNPWHWFSLGQTCLQFCESTDEQEDRETERHQEEAAELREDRVWLKACTCFIRTRLLLRILRQQQSSFVLQRSKRALHMAEEALQRLNPREATLQTLTEVMSEDLIPERMREDYQDGESLAIVCLDSFRQRWWNKILLTGLLETDGLQHETQRPHALVLTVNNGVCNQEGTEEPAEDGSNKQHSECGHH